MVQGFLAACRLLPYTIRMKTCIGCLTINPDDSTTCKNCGSSLGSQLAGTDATVQWSGPIQSPARGGSGALGGLDVLFASKTRVVIGCATDCDVCLPHPSVSRYHALLEQR